MRRRLSQILTLRTILFVLVLCGLVGLIVWYGVFQARLLIAGPQIHFAGPTETLQHERIIEVTGSAENIVNISLNGLPISTDEAGHFTHQLVLPDGYTIMTLTAEDRYGRVVTVRQPYVYASASPFVE